MDSFLRSHLRPSSINMTYPSGETGLFWSPILSLHDVLLMVLFGVAIFVTRALLNRLVFIPMAHYFAIYKPSYRAKLIENMWYCVYYPVMLGFAWWILSDDAFFPWNPEHYWKGFPNFADWNTRPLEFFYYTFQLGFYLQSIVALLTFETKRKDFVELCIHHSVTILLIVFSYCASQHRIGLNVLIIHDFSDIFLYTTKVLHYLDKFGKSSKTLLTIIVNVLFFAFAVAFAYSRNYIFPAFVVFPSVLAGFFDVPTNCPSLDCTLLAVKTAAGSAASGSQGLLGMLFRDIHYLYDPARSFWFEISHRGACVGGHCFHSGCVLIGMMVLLELLHIFWLVMIIRMIWRSLFQLKQVKQDIRSDSEDEEEWAENRKKKNKFE